MTTEFLVESFFRDQSWLEKCRSIVPFPQKTSPTSWKDRVIWNPTKQWLKRIGLFHHRCLRFASSPPWCDLMGAFASSIESRLWKVLSLSIHERFITRDWNLSTSRLTKETRRQLFLVSHAWEAGAVSLHGGRLYSLVTRCHLHCESLGSFHYWTL